MLNFPKKTLAEVKNMASPVKGGLPNLTLAASQNEVVTRKYLAPLPSPLQNPEPFSLEERQIVHAAKKNPRAGDKPGDSNIVYICSFKGGNSEMKKVCVKMIPNWME